MAVIFSDVHLYDIEIMHIVLLFSKSSKQELLDRMGVDNKRLSQLKKTNNWTRSELQGFFDFVTSKGELINKTAKIITDMINKDYESFVRDITKECVVPFINHYLKTGVNSRTKICKLTRKQFDKIYEWNYDYLNNLTKLIDDISHKLIDIDFLLTEMENENGK